MMNRSGAWADHRSHRQTMSGNGKHHHIAQSLFLYPPSFSVIFFSFFSLSLPLSFPLTCHISSVLGFYTIPALSLFQPYSSRLVILFSLFLCLFCIFKCTSVLHVFFQLHKKDRFITRKGTGGDLHLHRTDRIIIVNLMILKDFSKSTVNGDSYWALKQGDGRLCQSAAMWKPWQCTICQTIFILHCTSGNERQLNTSDFSGLPDELLRQERHLCEISQCCQYFGICFLHHLSAKEIWAVRSLQGEMWYLEY